MTRREDSVSADLHTGTNHRVVGDTSVVFDDSVVVPDVGLIYDVVVVAVEVNAVGDGDAVPDSEFPSVVEVNAVVDDSVVPDRDVVTVGERDSLEKPAVVAAVVEEVVGEHLPEPERELDVVRHRRRVELPPEPLEMFRAREPISSFSA